MKAEAKAPSSLPFVFQPGQRVRCVTGHTGIVQGGKHTAHGALYRVSFDGVPRPQEMAEKELKPAMMIAGGHEATATPFDFSVDQPVRCVAGKTGRVIKRWLTMAGAMYLVRTDSYGMALQVFESELSALPKSPGPGKELLHNARLGGQLLTQRLLCFCKLPLRSSTALPESRGA
jgi:hypothetical protein